MRRFLLVFATLSFVLCGFVDSAHAGPCDLSDDGYTLEFTNTGDTDGDADFTPGEHSDVHHHHHAAVGTTEQLNQSFGIQRFALNADVSRVSIAHNISKPPRS